MCSLFLPELSSVVAALLFAVHPVHTEAVSVGSGEGFLLCCAITLCRLCHITRDCAVTECYTVLVCCSVVHLAIRTLPTPSHVSHALPHSLTILLPTPLLYIYIHISMCVLVLMSAKVFQCSQPLATYPKNNRYCYCTHSQNCLADPP